MDNRTTAIPTILGILLFKIPIFILAVWAIIKVVFFL